MVLNHMQITFYILKNGGNCPHLGEKDHKTH